MAVMRITVENGPCSSRQTLPKQRQNLIALGKRLQNMHAHLVLQSDQILKHGSGALASPAQLDDLRSSTKVARNGCAGRAANCEEL